MSSASARKPFAPWRKFVIAVTRSSSWSIRDWLRLTCPRKCFQ
jgi:hypothetical protein